ncbi:alpha/beta hydrolase [Anaerorhabdus sp.]|uniref:alpha/beta hydrolase n=1 Tax=Anaerorhabdus sp. TaxID=1872524 RepID=UPI002FC84037
MAKRSYNVDLIKEMNERCYYKTMANTKIIMKPIPETDEVGILDERYLKKIKSVSKLTRFVPDQLLKLGPNKTIVDGLKIGFDLKKSKIITTDELKVDQITIRGKDNNLLPLRIYHPNDKSKPSPILYYIHGGGFFAGNLDVPDEYLRYIACNYNILIFSIDYRLAPQYPYPKGHEDCYEGFKWVCEHCDYYYGNINQIFVSGDSAGGNLAHYCVIKDIEEEQFKIKGQCLLYPALNLAEVVDEYSSWAMNKYEISKKQEDAVNLSIQLIKNGGVQIMNGVLNENPNNIYLTPYLYETTKLPPTLIMVGEYDYLKVESIAYTIKNKKIGNPIELLIYKGMGHGFGDFFGYYPQAEDSAIEIAEFILNISNYSNTKQRKLLSEDEARLLRKDDENLKRKYSTNLISIMNRKSNVEILDGNPVIIKPILDDKYKEKLDKHVITDIKTQEFIIRIASEIYNNVKLDEKMIDELRKNFNEVKSLPIASNKIKAEDITIIGNEGNEIPLKIYHPLIKTKNIPILFFIHGGAFVAGSLNVVEQFVKYIVEKFNVLAFSVDYRLAPENEYPKGHQDCYDTLSWIAKYAYLIGGDTNQLFISGDSAGGNLAQYCVLRSLKENGPKIKAQMLLYPSVNLVENDDENIEWENKHFEVDNSHPEEIQSSLNAFKKYLNQIMKKALNTDGNDEYISPYISNRTDLPPTLLAVGEYDFLKVECLAYMAKLHDRHIPTRTILYKGFSHGFIDSIGYHIQSEDLAIEVGNFIKTNIKKNH